MVDKAVYVGEKIVINTMLKVQLLVINYSCIRNNRMACTTGDPLT